MYPATFCPYNPLHEITKKSDYYVHILSRRCYRCINSDRVPTSYADGDGYLHLHFFNTNGMRARSYVQFHDFFSSNVVIEGRGAIHG